LPEVGTALGKLDPQSIAIVASARMTNEELFQVKRLAGLLKVDAVDVVPGWVRPTDI